MWEKTLIESKRFGRATRTRWTLPFAAFLHAGLIATAILVSYWRVEAVEAPPQGITFERVVPVTMAPPPPRGTKRASSRPAQSTTKAVPKNVQPTIIQPLTNQNTEEAVTEPGDGTESGPNLPVGVPWGDPFATGPVNSTVDEPHKMSVNIVEPVLIKRVEPEYPRSAMVAHIEGMVIFEAIITRTGSVDQVKTLRADHPLLEKAARDAVLQWKYQPAMLQGQPVKVYFTVTVTFHMR